MSGHDRRPTAVPAQDGTPSAEPVRCTVVVVSYNSAADLLGLLASLKVAAPEDDLRVMVVDNASSDDTLAILGREFPDVRAIANERNLGFATAVNQGLATVGTALALRADDVTRLLAAARTPS